MGKQAYRKVRVRAGRFDHTKPPRTTVLKGEAGLKGSLELVRGGSTAPNLLEPLSCRGKQAYREGSSEFEAVRPHRTSSNHCDEGGGRHTGKDRVRSGRFEYTEPPRITVTKG